MDKRGFLWIALASDKKRFCGILLKAMSAATTYHFELHFGSVAKFWRTRRTRRQRHCLSDSHTILRSRKQLRNSSTLRNSRRLSSKSSRGKTLPAAVWKTNLPPSNVPPPG